MKKMLNEFKQFAIKGNMIDLAVGMIIGTSFNKIVSSLVNDMIMPILGIFTGKIDRSQVLALQRSATVLVNPRRNNEEYTKYSFPSKTMEYLAVIIVAAVVFGLCFLVDKAFVKLFRSQAQHSQTVP
mgnify:CR=1 FL=1